MTVDKNTTHIVLMKSPRIGKQLQLLGREIDSGNQAFLQQCYKKATSNRFGHLLVDLSPGCNDALRFCSNITGNTVVGHQNYPTIFYLAQSTAAENSENLRDDKQTSDIYVEALSDVYPSSEKVIYSTL